MTESTLKIQRMIFRKIMSNNIIGFSILILFILLNPGCTKDSTIPTPRTKSTISAKSTSPAEKTQVAKNASTTAFHIGDNYGGGIIFYVDGTGQHGLIADMTDTNYRMIKWGDSYYLNTGATGTAVGTGAGNTKKIIAVQGTKYNYAALVCVNYRGGGYADWFLPSKDELYLLYKQKIAGVVKGFTWGAYWSSSEFYVASIPKQQAYAWTKIFYSENAFYSLKDRVAGVRAIRVF